jgi:hypothetical protein
MAIFGLIVAVALAAAFTFAPLFIEGGRDE